MIKTTNNSIKIQGKPIEMMALLNILQSFYGPKALLSEVIKKERESESW